ncbi:ammonium transporter [Fructobacillus pseudoficulneus]|uniref:Ammonium transporter n=1 Tax=Fructobacillus pseudoficulneus TaxID=220714 RepID=A0A3F3GQ97_9LACO|nr:ammonium transporter [Fructobacillus pseudoficulneus]GAP02131.1 ammonium transporter [Fructobacillus pseudoficulneus]SEH35826.1 ammonium transporter (TC 1.A.11) [Fructobacillus pseudoficulneus]
MDSGSIAWVLTSAVLVWIMTPGLGLFYAGLGDKKNSLHTVGLSVLIIGLATVVWGLLGYSLAFGGSGSFIGNLHFWGMNHVSLSGSTRGLTIPDGAFAIFQGMFPIITVAIITGSVVGRMRLKDMLVFLTLWLLFIYAPLAHMVWDNGFIAKLGAIDFAGGTVVHISSGVTGLVLALVLGPRKSRKPNKTNPTFVLVGGFLLWVGWFGFNSGSALAANNQAIVALVNSWFASSAAVLSWAAIAYQIQKKVTVDGLVTGALAGLVAITPAAGYVQPWASIVMGLIAGVLGFVSITAIKNFFGYDDTLDAFGIHGIGGTVGALLTGVFASQSLSGGAKGLIEGSWTLLGHQVLAILITLVLVIIGTLILIALTRLIAGPLRVTEADEESGYDKLIHIVVVDD